MKEKGILSRFVIVILVLLALVLIFPSAKIDLASGIKASTQASVRVEHIQNFARSAEMDVQLLSADDPAYQQIANVLSGLTCVKRFNQQYSSYSHEYPVDSVTVSYYDDAENNNLLFTVYSDGTAIVNSQFVFRTAKGSLFEGAGMVSAMTEGVKNKNRGTQVVKLHVPFLFFFCTWCGTNHTECRASSRGSKLKPQLT